jgi:MYXO-CTERM domain-containing protein
VFAALTYAVLPTATGAVAGGRLDVVVAVILLPLLVRATGAALSGGIGRWHRWVAAGLLLALVAAFAPVVWPLAAASLVLVVGCVGAGRRQRALAAAAMLAVPVLVLMPWTTWLVQHPRLLIAGSGLSETFAARQPLGAADLLLMHPGGPAQPPVWVFAPFVLAAIVALCRRRGAALAVVGFAVFAVGVAGALVESRLTGAAASDPAVRYWAGVPLAVAALGALCAALVAADGARVALRRHTFGWRQPAAALLAAAAVVGSAVSLGAWVVRGAARPLTDATAVLLPVFAAAEVGRPTAPRVVALRSDGSVVRYALVREPSGPRLGDADVLRHGRPGAADGRLADAVRALAGGQASGVPALAGFGVTLLVVPNADAPALARIANVDGLGRVPTAGAVVWHIGVPTGELVVLGPATARRVQAGASLPDTAVPQPLAARAGHARVFVAAGRAGRLLVLAEPASSRWRARLDGKTLPSARAYGWAQAWQLPAGSGRLVVDRVGDHRSRWLAGELAALVVLCFLALPTRRRGDDDLRIDEPGATS